MCFLKHFRKLAIQREMFEKVWKIIILLLSKDQSVSFVTILMEKLFYLVPQYKRYLFAKSNSVCTDLVSQALRLCNSSILPIRNEAVTLYTELFKNNFAETKNVDRVRLQSTVGIIRLLDDVDDSSVRNWKWGFALLED